MPSYFHWVPSGMYSLMPMYSTWKFQSQLSIFGKFSVLVMLSLMFVFRNEHSMPIKAGIFFEMFPFCILFEVISLLTLVTVVNNSNYYYSIDTVKEMLFLISFVKYLRSWIDVSQLSINGRSLVFYYLFKQRTIFLPVHNIYRKTWQWRTWGQHSGRHHVNSERNSSFKTYH